jgi:hypothetical protein
MLRKNYAAHCAPYCLRVNVSNPVGTANDRPKEPINWSCRSTARFSEFKRLSYRVSRVCRCCKSVAKVLQSEKTQWKYWREWTFRPLKNTKITTETHEMGVLEAMENETLESHSRRYCFVVFRSCSSVGRERRAKQRQPCQRVRTRRSHRRGHTLRASPVKTTKTDGFA